MPRFVDRVRGERTSYIVRRSATPVARVSAAAAQSVGTLIDTSARLDAALSARGAAVADADLVIAATAVWLDYQVVTGDLRSFPRIKGLDVVRW